MGAGAWRLIRQLLTESILLATIGAAFGLLLARWADAALVRLVSGGTDLIPLDVHLDSRVLLFTLSVAVLTGILFGLVPALRAARLDLNPILKGTSRASPVEAASRARAGGKDSRRGAGRLVVSAFGDSQSISAQL